MTRAARSREDLPITKRLATTKTPASAATSTTLARAFYSVSDSRFFLGVVAMLNSLRLLGHDEPIFLVDAGLTCEQRSLLEGHVTLVPALDGVPAVFLAPFGLLEHPADVAIILDADILVVRPLTNLIETAEGRLVAFINDAPNHDRFFAEWSTALGLGPLRRQAYVNAGQMIVPHSLALRVLRPWTEGQAKIGTQQSRYGNASLSDPFYFADQDVLNAVLAALLEPDEIMIVGHRLAPHPPFAGLRLVDKHRLVCRYLDGVQPFFLHHILGKPWLTATRTNIYSLLLTRLLLAPDVALQLRPEQLPLRLREGWLSSADRNRANIQALVHASVRRQLGKFGIRTRLAARRRRHAVTDA